jgi:DUSAM domain-containing protein
MATMQDDWEDLRSITTRLGENSAIDPAACGALLLRIGPTVGVEIDECTNALGTPEGAARLACKLGHLIDEGDGRFAKALIHAQALDAQGDRDQARRVLSAFIEAETVHFFRDLAAYRLGTLGDP